MGAMAGFMDVLGRHMQGVNEREAKHSDQANREMADMLENLSKTAKPEYAPDYIRAATLIRMTPMGKKPPKEALDVYGLLLKQSKAAMSQSQTRQGQPGSDREPYLPGLEPPPGQAQSQSQAPGLPTAPQGGAPMPPGSAPSPASTPVPGGPNAAQLTGALTPPPTSGAGMRSLAQPTAMAPTPPTPPPGFTPPPGMEFTQVTPFEQAQFKQQQMDYQRAKLMQEGQQLFGEDNYAIANYINEKTVDRPASNAEKWASAGQGIIYNTTTGETYSVANTEEKLHTLAPGEKLFSGDGRLIAEGGQKLEPPPNTPFESMLADFRAKNGREPNQAEVLEMQKNLQTVQGEPLYPVMVNGQPTLMPRSKATGMPAPRTVYDMSGTPTTGGVVGTSLTPPPVVSDTAQQQLAGLKNSIGQFNDVDQLFKDPAYQTLGPVLGRIKVTEVQKLGGLGATPQEITMAIRLQRLLSSQAFAEAGKTLTIHELQQFKLMTPGMEDTVASAVIKTREALRFLNNVYQNRLSVMPARQRGQIDPNMNSNSLTPPPSTNKLNSNPNINPNPNSSALVRMEVNGQQFNVKPENVAEAERRGARRVQ